MDSRSDARVGVSTTVQDLLHERLILNVHDTSRHTRFGGLDTVLKGNTKSLLKFPELACKGTVGTTSTGTPVKDVIVLVILNARHPPPATRPLPSMHS